MGYQALLDSNLNKAFNMAKDLVQDVTFVKKPSPAFSFTTGQTTFGTDQNVLTKALIYNSKKTSKDQNVVVKEVLFKSKEIGDATLYDKVLVENQSWDLIQILKNDGFISVVQISKEV